MKKESSFQKEVIDALKVRFPGCLVLKNDPTYIQGIPDLLVLFDGEWAALECKRSANEGIQPNQEYYIEKLGAMAYASFIYPENKEEVLDEIQQSFLSRRATCLPESE